MVNFLALFDPLSRLRPKTENQEVPVRKDFRQVRTDSLPKDQVFATSVSHRSAREVLHSIMGLFPNSCTIRPRGALPGSFPRSVEFSQVWPSRFATPPHSSVAHWLPPCPNQIPFHVTLCHLMSSFVISPPKFRIRYAHDKGRPPTFLSLL
jgi:hypothetical protein